MTHDQVRRNVVRGALSSYLRVAVRLGLGLVTFRLLYQGLTREQFGFWSLLWAIFGSGILLDFGLGYAAQKRVAELSVRQDWPELSRVLSTILGVHLLGALVAAGLGIGFAGSVVDLCKVSPANREEFRLVLQVFLVGMSLAFPLGLFTDILQGQQRITTANHLALVSLSANFLAIVTVTWLHLGFLTLVTLALLCVLVPSFAAAWLALRHLPHVRLSPSRFDRRTLVEISRFSVYAYLNTLGNVLRDKTDAPVIGAILGVAAIAPYQAGGKVGEMFGMLTRQIADVLSPTAAHLHAKGDPAGLREMFIAGLRFNVLAATPLFVLTLAYMEGLIRLLTGEPHPTSDMYWSGQLLLLWSYSLALTHWVFKRMFLMAGQERRLMWQGLTEAALNLTLSLSLTWSLRSVLGVALGSVIPTVLFGWGQLWGWAAHEAGVSRWTLFRRIVVPAWFGCLPMIALLLVFRWQPWWPSGSQTSLVLVEGALLGAVGLAGIHRLSLDTRERSALLRALRRSG